MDTLIQRIQTRGEDPELRISLGKSKSLFPPTTFETVAAAEVRLGFRLPPLLRRIYTEVANGGIGPGTGLVGLSGGALAYDGSGKPYNLVEYYFLYRKQEVLPEIHHDFTDGSSVFSAAGLIN